MYAWVFQVASFLQISPPKLGMHFSSPHTRYLSLPFHLVRNANHEAPQFVLFSTLLLLSPCQVKYVPQCHVLPSVWQTRFHTHLKLQTKLCCVFWSSHSEVRNETKCSGPDGSSHLPKLFWSQEICCDLCAKFPTVSKDLLAVVILWFCPAFCSRDMSCNCVFLPFTFVLNSN